MVTDVAAPACGSDVPPHASSRGGPIKIRAAVLLPAQPEFITSLAKVRPVLDIAVRDLYTSGVLSDTEVTFDFVEKDDRCEDIEAIRSSFELIIKGRVDLFLGPTCDYGVGQ